MAANRGAAGRSERRIPIPNRLILLVALHVLFALTIATSLAAAAASAATSQQRSPPRRRRGAAKKDAAAESIKDESAPPRAATSDRERGWPPFYPRKFSSSTAEGGKENATTMTETVETKPKDLTPPPLPTTRDPDKDGESKSEKNSKGASASAEEPRSSSGSSSASSATDPSSGTKLNTTTFFRRSRQLFAIQSQKKNNNETASPTLLAEQVEEKTTTTNTNTIAAPSKEGGTDAVTSSGKADPSRESNTTSANGTSTAGATPSRAQDVDGSGNQTITAPNASAASDPPASPQQQQTPSGGLILLGTPPPSIPYRIYRRGTATGGGGGGGLAGTGWDPTSPPGRGGVPPTTTTPASSNAAVVLAELATSVLGTVTRILLLRSITGWLAKQEEAMAPTQHFVWECLNDRFVRDESALGTALSAPPAGMSAAQWRRQVRSRIRNVRRAQHERIVCLRRKARDLQLLLHHDNNESTASALAADDDDLAMLPRLLDPTAAYARTVVVVELTSESKDGPDNDHLADIVTFLLGRHRNHAFGTNATNLRPSDLEVVVLVQSPGGSVSSFGLAAAQLRRLSGEPGIFTTVCVDKYAASGGYMIASQAHQLVAAPFASVGSVGVILEGLNFHELARNWGVQPLVIKAGDSKNPITTFGSVTKQDMDHQREQLEKVHVAFKDLVVRGRPALGDKLDRVANGNVFLGEEALGLDLVDRVATSSQYLMEKVESGDRVLKLHRSSPSRFPRRVGTISPLDILPHLRSRFANLRNEAGDMLNRQTLSTWIAQGITYLSLFHHLHAQYWRSR